MAGGTAAPIKDLKEGNCHHQESLEDDSREEDFVAISQAK